jgi:hypothetical protein
MLVVAQLQEQVKAGLTYYFLELEMEEQREVGSKSIA